FSDGHLVLPPEFVFGPMPKDQLTPILARHGISPDDPIRSVLNITLLRDGDNLILFDTGSGPSFQQTAGELAAALDAAGIAPEDITHVIFTHGHPDHLWGVLDDFDDPYFYEAQHMMGRVEWDYWYNGKQASEDIQNNGGIVIVQKGELREGGSYLDRMSKVTVWNSFMDEHNYLTRKWNEFMSALTK
ncbi:MAG: hypothetical protein COA78_16340, partial [Blastopirellula sp.]